MAQRRISFEWVIDEDPLAPWQGAQEEIIRSGATAPESWLTRRIAYAFSLLLVALFTTAGAGLSHDEHARLMAEDGIEFVLNQEDRAWHTRDRSLFEALIDPNVDEEWRDEWRNNWRMSAEAAADYRTDLLYVQSVDGMIQATVLTHQPALEWWQTSPYREARFYRRTGQSWLRSLPPAAFWGQQRTLETDHLVFEFFERDAEAVTDAAPVLEQAYVDMHRLLRLEMPVDVEKLTIRVGPNPSGRWSSSPDELDVSSPLLAQIPDGQSAAEFLAYDVMGWFTYRAMRDASPGSASRYLYRWPILVWGLRGWLRDDLLDQPSPWREEALQILQDAAPTYLPLGLTDVTELRGQNRPTREQVILRYLAAESCISFVADTYGRDQLPDLLRSLVRHGSWEEIIPEVYGHSVEKFVADWNIYILEKYMAADQ